jgi:hypothetical protein
MMEAIFVVPCSYADVNSHIECYMYMYICIPLYIIYIYIVLCVIDICAFSALSIYIHMVSQIIWTAREAHCTLWAASRGDVRSKKSCFVRTPLDVEKWGRRRARDARTIIALGCSAIRHWWALARLHLGSRSYGIVPIGRGIILGFR